MYNRILNRPMFKRGGDVMDAQGTGITSGLDTPRRRYSEGIFGEIDVSVPESTRKRAFWSGIGEGFANARTLGEALRGTVQGQEKILGPAEAKSAERGFQLEKAAIEMPYQRETLVKLEEIKAQSGIDIAEIAASKTATAQKFQRNDRQLANGTISKSEHAANEQKIISGSDLASEASRIAQSLIQSGTVSWTGEDDDIDALAKQILRMMIILQKGLAPTMATGGRVGYQFGTPNQGVQPMQASLNVDETIQTPQGTMQEDVSVQEKIQPSVNMTYQEFRAKIPPQVDDEIVQLIYYNQDAFADFAQIKTQDEVYAFNNKYGVSLVLPFDTEIT